MWYWKTPKRARDAIEVNLTLMKPSLQAAIGHTRWKTQGAITKNENNHPVVEDHIVLVHNGMISNDYTLFREMFDKDYVRAAEVDTQVIAALLAHQADFNFDHPAELLELLQGSAAVAWFDNSDTSSLHLARVKERPLTIGRTRCGDLVMSSTPGTLAKWSLLANIKVRDVEEIEEGTYLRVVDSEIVERTDFKVPSYLPSKSTTTTTTSGKVPLGSSAKPPIINVPRDDTDDDLDWEYWNDGRSYRQNTDGTFVQVDFDDPEDDDDNDDAAYLEWNYRNIRSLYQQGHAEFTYQDVLEAYDLWMEERDERDVSQRIEAMTDEEYLKFRAVKEALTAQLSAGSITLVERRMRLDDVIATIERDRAVAAKRAATAQPQLQLVKGEG